MIFQLLAPALKKWIFTVESATVRLRETTINELVHIPTAMTQISVNQLTTRFGVTHEILLIKF